MNEIPYTIAIGVAPPSQEGQPEKRQTAEEKTGDGSSILDVGDRPLNIDDSQELKAVALQMIVDQLKRADSEREKGGGDTKQDHRWGGSKLWTDTVVRPLMISDLLGEKGVEGCYSASLIPGRVIRALRHQYAGALQEELRKRGWRKGGMLHEFRVAPLKTNVPSQESLSVYETMLTQLRQNEPRKMNTQGRMLSRYEGSILCPKDDPSMVLAWAAWTRSWRGKPHKRRADNDEAVREVHSVIKSLKLSGNLDRSFYFDNAHKILLADTIDTRIIGGASRLCAGSYESNGSVYDTVYDMWMENGYKYMITYRHKLLQIIDLARWRRGDKQAMGFPQGNNDASQEFLQARGCHELGERMSPILARRVLRDDENAGRKREHVVLSTE